MNIDWYRIADGYYSCWGDSAYESNCRVGLYSAVPVELHEQLTKLLRAVDAQAEHINLTDKDLKYIVGGM